MRKDVSLSVENGHQVEDCTGGTCTENSGLGKSLASVPTFLHAQRLPTAKCLVCNVQVPTEVNLEAREPRAGVPNPDGGAVAGGVGTESQSTTGTADVGERGRGGTRCQAGVKKCRGRRRHGMSFQNDRGTECHQQRGKK